MDCPRCGGAVTMEVGPDRPPSASVVDALLSADEGDQIEIARNCWECGWSEDRAVSIDAIEKTDGDAVAVERANRIDDIMSEVTTIDSLAALEDALAAVRRHRRMDSAASGSGTDRDDESELSRD